jgi:hypothetical protein
VRRIAAAFLALTLGLGLEACERCAGILGCTSDPRLSMGGQLIVRETGAPVRGVALDFMRTGGVALASDSVRATTDAYGHFQLAVDAAEMGEVVGDLVVRAPAPWSPYRVGGLRFRTSNVRGEGQILGRMVVVPYIEFIGELHNRSSGQRLSGAQVTIRRTGGVDVSPDSFDITTGSDGRIYFKAQAANPGDMVADLVVTSPAQGRTFRRSDVHFSATYLDRIPELAAVWRFGTVLPYVGEIYYRGTGARSAGIQVKFQRTGGILVDRDSFVTSTGSDGRFPFLTTPLADGELVGRLIIRPPALALPETLQTLRVPTVDTDQLLLLGVWGYGQQILYAGELFLRGTGMPAVGLEVEFRRTGGIAISPETLVVHTDATGRFPLAPSNSADGEVVGTLVVRLPAPLAPDTIAGVHLATFASDEMRFLGRWGVGPSLAYVGEVRELGTDAPVVNATVEFQRTDGIQVTPSLLVGHTGSDGRFLLNPSPQSDGDVVGNLTIHPTAPLRDTTVTGVRLQTFRGDGLRLAGVWRLVPPQ